MNMKPAQQRDLRRVSASFRNVYKLLQKDKKDEQTNRPQPYEVTHLHMMVLYHPTLHLCRFFCLFPAG